MKKSADLGGFHLPQPSASVDNTLLDLQNSSYPTQPHSIIAKYIPNRAHHAELATAISYPTNTSGKMAFLRKRF